MGGYGRCQSSSAGGGDAMVTSMLRWLLVVGRWRSKKRERRFSRKVFFVARGLSVQAKFWRKSHAACTLEASERSEAKLKRLV